MPANIQDKGNVFREMNLGRVIQLMDVLDDGIGRQWVVPIALERRRFWRKPIGGEVNS